MEELIKQGIDTINNKDEYADIYWKYSQLEIIILKMKNLKIMEKTVTKKQFHKFIEEELEFIVYDTLVDEDDNLAVDNLYDVLTSKYNLTLK
jgi:hypothetical protein